MDAIRAMTAQFDTYISTEIGQDMIAEIAGQMVGVVALAALVIVGVLLFTSRSYFEVVIFLVVFSVAALLNMGTNFWLGEISSITVHHELHRRDNAACAGDRLRHHIFPPLSGRDGADSVSVARHRRRRGCHSRRGGISAASAEEETARPRGKRRAGRISKIPHMTMPLRIFIRRGNSFKC